MKPINEDKMTKLTNEQEINLYSWCIHEGISLQYGKLSLCDLRNFQYSNLIKDRKYQVHCEDTQHTWTMIYSDLRTAVIKFLELKKRIRRLV